MNTNKTLSILVGLILLTGHGVCAPQQSAKSVTLTRQGAARLEISVARAVVWQLYWWQGKTIEQLRKQVAEAHPIAYTLCRGENEEPCAYLESYQWKVTLTEIAGEHYGFDVEDYRALARGDAAEAKRSYLEALKREPAVLKKGLLQLRPEHLSVLAFEKPGQQQYSIITNTVVTNLLSSRKTETLKQRMTADKVRSPLVIHIGGVNTQSPWVYYHVEGMPYLGMILFDPSTGQMLHDDLQYIHENPREAEYENVRRSVDNSGTTLSLGMEK